MIVVGMAGKQTDYLTTEFLYDFRKLAHKNRFHLDDYEFALIDIDDEEMFNYLITFNLGRFDSPGIFVVKDMKRQVYYRTYETYNGDANFFNISEGLMIEINQMRKMVMYSHWNDRYLNLLNYEHWMNNLMKAYMYMMGVLAVIFIPILLLIDCFVPILGRGPHAERKRAEKSEQNSDHKAKQEVPRGNEKKEKPVNGKIKH